MKRPTQLSRIGSNFYPNFSFGETPAISRNNYGNFKDLISNQANFRGRLILNWLVFLTQIKEKPKPKSNFLIRS